MDAGTVTSSERISDQSSEAVGASVSVERLTVPLEWVQEGQSSKGLLILVCTPMILKGDASKALPFWLEQKGTNEPDDDR